MNVFRYFIFETSFLKAEHIFEKLESQFLVESTTIENVAFPFKAALSKADVTTNRMNLSQRTEFYY